MDRSANGSMRGIVLVVVGASGGSGASTLAAACALRAADIGCSVALVDTVAGGAGIDVVLGIEHLPGVRWPELAGCRGRVDGLGLLARMPRAGAVAVLAHCRDSPVRVGAAAERGVIAGISDVVDLVVVDVPRSWSLGGWAELVGSEGLDVDEAVGGVAGSDDPVSRGFPLGGPAFRAVVVAGSGIIELAALAATAPRVAALVPETFVVLRGHRLSATVVSDVEGALDLPVLGVLDDDQSVGRDLARGIPPGRGRGSLAELAHSVIEAVARRRHEAAS
jgi:hypothetical protein